MSLKTVERAGALDKPQRLANCVETDNDTDAGHTDANISVIKKREKNPHAHVFVFFSPSRTCAFVFYNLSHHMAFTCDVLGEGAQKIGQGCAFFYKCELLYTGNNKHSKMEKGRSGFVIYVVSIVVLLYCRFPSFLTIVYSLKRGCSDNQMRSRNVSTYSPSADTHTLPEGDGPAGSGRIAAFSWSGSLGSLHPITVATEGLVRITPWSGCQSTTGHILFTHALRV